MEANMPGVQHEVLMLAARDGGADLVTKQLNGRDHLVVPSVILVEGVLWSSNATEPALALASEFGMFPQGWDGRPIVHNHPKLNGNAVSANSPDKWESEVVGQLFGSILKEGRKLKTDLWLDSERAPKETLDALRAGESIEVSTGLYALAEEAKGEFDGKEYKVIWRNIVPDHLAVLPKGTIGACSNEDGCGAPRANQTGRSLYMQPPKGLSQPAAAPDPTVQVPATPTPTPAANDCGCEPTLKSLEKKTPGFLRNLLNNFMSKVVGLNISELSDGDKRTALEAALSVAEGDKPFYIISVYASSVVYACLDDNYNFHVYRRSYSVAEGGGIKLSADFEEVRPETQYVPVAVTINSPPGTTKEGASMTTAIEKTPEVLAAEEAARKAAAAAGTPAAPAVVASASETPAVSQPSIPKAKAKSLAELMDLAEPDVKQQLTSMIAAQAARGAQLIKALEGKVGLSADELKKFDLETLEKMAKQLNPAAAGVDFSGAGGGPAAQPVVVSEQFTPPPPVFPANFSVPATEPKDVVKH